MLSKHVSHAEFIRSETALKYGLSNDFANENHKKSAINLCEKIFEPLRSFIGKPIIISSGYRSAVVNDRIKPRGSITSQHLRGEAMDIHGSKSDNVAYFNFIKDNLIFDQLIWEFGDDSAPAWVHVSLNPLGKQRKQVLIAYKIGGATKYKPY